MESEMFKSRLYVLTWKYLIKYELSSSLGRIFYNKKPKKINSDLNLLHLGCGLTYLKGFINADFFYLRWMPWRSKKDYDWLLDFRYKFNCEDNYWDGVFSEHTIEHIHPTDCINLFKELYRTMKPGSWIRFCVPGLDETLDPFTENPTKDGLEWRQINPEKTRAEAIYSLTQYNGHVSVWDYPTMAKALQQAGFKNTHKESYMSGNDKRLLLDSSKRRLGSMYIEAQK